MPKIIMIKISEKDYERLVEKASKEGFVSVTDFVRTIVLKELGSIEERREKTLVDEKIVQRLERKMQDLVNPWTHKIEELAKKLSELYERLEEVEEKVKGLENEVKELREQKAVAPGTRRQALEKTPKRKTAIERLREQGVVFESDVYWLRDRKAFFEKLKREGAVIVNTPGERIAVDKAYWTRFMEKLESIASADEEEVRSLLDDTELKLFEKLRKAGIVFFDAHEGKWVVDLDSVEGF